MKNNNITNSLKFTLKIISSVGKNCPKIRVSSSSKKTVLNIPEGISYNSFLINDTGSLVLDFFNKTEDDTITDDNGNIIKDTEFRITDIWVNDIKLESWVLTNAVYKPRYFSGFLKEHPNADAKILSPFQFNFPGIIEWEWESPFWDWYFIEKNKNEVINFLDKDQDRVWKFRGSLDPCNDIINDIKKILGI